MTLHAGMKTPMQWQAMQERLAELEADNTILRQALEWYREQSRLARLIHSGGDAGRQAIAKDGGVRAHIALTWKEQP